jgi:type IV pilus assembly protein PilX
MPSVHRNLNYPDNQRGWVLVVGLVILVMLTILSMALMKTTRLEEKMAGATRDMNLSFQAAETALRGAENFIESQTDESIFETTANGIYSQAGDEHPDDLFTVVWDDTNSKAMFADEDEALQGVTLSPRYMIKKLKKMGGSNLTITGYGEDNATPTIFRITVRGTGGTNNRATLLRSHYAKVF